MKNLIKKLEAESLQKNIDQLTGRSELQNAIKAANVARSYQENLDKIMSSSAAQSALTALSAVNAHQERLDKLMSSSVAQNALKALSATSSYQNTIEKLVSSSSFQNAVDTFSKHPNLWQHLDWHEYSEGGIATHELQDTDLDDANTERQLQLIGEASDLNSVSIAISNLSPKIKYIFIVFFLFLLSRAIAITDNIAANIITPHVEKLINDPSTTERKKVKQLKSLSLDELDLSNLRFITTEHLLLRESPSTKSEIKEELRFGQVVTMLSKQRNWMEIYYEDGDGKIHVCPEETEGQRRAGKGPGNKDESLQ